MECESSCCPASSADTGVDVEPIHFFFSSHHAARIGVRRPTRELCATCVEKCSIVSARATELAGRLLDDDEDGVEVGPAGELLRQVVHQRMPWECTTWVSKDGVVYDRCFDPFRHTFVWTAQGDRRRAATGYYTTIVGRDSDHKRPMRLARASPLRGSSRLARGSNCSVRRTRCGARRRKRRVGAQRRAPF